MARASSARIGQPDNWITWAAFTAPKRPWYRICQRPPGTRLRSPLFFLVAAFSVLLITGCEAVPLPASPPPTTTAASSYVYTAIWQGHVVRLTLVPGTNVGQLPDAVAIGQVAHFHTDDPYYLCLEGAALNVWSAPQEFPKVYVVQGGCPGGTIGTWTFPQPPSVTPTPSP
jgi:hypothetical protein